MSIPGVSTDIGDAESVPVVIGANETFTVRANTQVGYLNPPILEQGAQQVIEQGAIFYPAGQQSGPAPGGSLTVRELDGSPTGTATELVFPNGSLSFAGDVVTITGLEGPQGPQGIQGIQGIQGPAGINGTNGTNGADGAPGPNEVTTSTATNITGLFGGNGSTVTQVSALGNISLTGAIGSTANLPLITGVDGVITVGSFGTTANTFCQGNDSRVVNAVNRNGDTLAGCLRTTEQTSTPTGTTATLTLDNGNHQTLSLASASGDVAVTLTVPSSSAAGTIILLQGTTVRNVTWTTSSGSIVWMGGEPDWDDDAVSTSRVIAWRWNGSVMRLAATEVSS
jgi:hypothetical protein